MSLLTDLQNLADHLSPSEVQTGERVVGALIKVLEHQGVTVPAVEELLPEEHPARIAPPAPAAPAPQQDESRLARIEAALAELLGHNQTSEPGHEAAGSETSAPSSEPEPSGPELDRP